MKSYSADEKIMLKALKMAYEGIEKGAGGPFGAVITNSKGEVVARAYNSVLQDQDPTSHAEIMAIRKLKSVDLRGHSLYASGYPCPMCLSAILWARIPKLFYCNTYAMATEIAFDDSLFMSSLGEIYDCSPSFLEESKSELLQIKRIALDEGQKLYDDWASMENKGHY